MILGYLACDGESFGYRFKDDLMEINRNSELVMEGEAVLFS